MFPVFPTPAPVFNAFKRKPTSPESDSRKRSRPISENPIFSSGCSWSCSEVPLICGFSAKSLEMCSFNIVLRKGERRIESYLKIERFKKRSLKRCTSSFFASQSLSSLLLPHLFPGNFALKTPFFLLSATERFSGLLRGCIRWECAITGMPSDSASNYKKREYFRFSCQYCPWVLLGFTREGIRVWILLMIGLSPPSLDQGINLSWWGPCNMISMIKNLQCDFGVGLNEWTVWILLVLARYHITIINWNADLAGSNWFGSQSSFGLAIRSVLIDGLDALTMIHRRI